MDIKTGLWEKNSQAGNLYYTGKVTIEGKEYWANVYVNDRKTEEKHPDMNLVLKLKV